MEDAIEQDKVCRIGGEEIAILLPDTSLEESILAADNVCNAVRDINPKINGQMLGKVTVSIGIATYPESSNGVEGLMKDADIALYQAKENGRDQHVHSGLKTTAVPLKTLPREASSG
jgi:diguanylate cyclase (GGDEF)-like protein